MIYDVRDEYVPEGVLFDLDGTILHNMPIAYRAHLVLCTTYKVPAVTFERFVLEVQPPYDVYYGQVCGIQAPMKEVFATFFAAYHELEHETELMHGARETLVALRRRGVRLGIVSASDPDAMVRKLERFAIATEFDAVVGAKYEKVESIQQMARSLKIDPARTLYVGDRPSDVRDGFVAGVVPVGFTGGYDVVDFLRTGCPTAHIIHALPELLKVRV